jgi:hypothetical protein
MLERLAEFQKNQLRNWSIIMHLHEEAVKNSQKQEKSIQGTYRGFFTEWLEGCLSQYNSHFK